jgi:hypothetical protein
MSKHNTHPSDADSGKPHVADNARVSPTLPTQASPLLPPTTTDSASKRKHFRPTRGRAFQAHSDPRETRSSNINTSVQAEPTRTHPSECRRSWWDPIFLALSTLLKYKTASLIHCHFNLDLIFCWAVLFLSCGAPYWYYRWIRESPIVEDTSPNRVSTNSGSETRIPSTPFGERKIQRLSRFWKSQQIIVGVTIAWVNTPHPCRMVTLTLIMNRPLFPLISVSPLPKCSWAYIFAALALLYAIMTFSISVFYKEHFELPRYYKGADLKVFFFALAFISNNLFPCLFRADKGSFFHKDRFQVWVFLSLPSAWFTGWIVIYFYSPAVLTK